MAQDLLKAEGLTAACAYRARMEEGRALGAAAAAEVVEAAHAQVDVALHYGIAYPRLQHVDPGTVGGDGDFRRRSTRANTRLGRLRRSGMQKQFRPAGSSK